MFNLVYALFIYSSRLLEIPCTLMKTLFKVAWIRIVVRAHVGFVKQ